MTKFENPRITVYQENAVVTGRARLPIVRIQISVDCTGKAASVPSGQRLFSPAIEGEVVAEIPLKPKVIGKIVEATVIVEFKDTGESENFHASGFEIGETVGLDPEGPGATTNLNCGPDGCPPSQ